MQSLVVLCNVWVMWCNDEVHIYSVCNNLLKLCNDWIVLHNAEVMLRNNGVGFVQCVLYLRYTRRAVVSP